MDELLLDGGVITDLLGPFVAPAWLVALATVAYLVLRVVRLMQEVQRPANWSSGTNGHQGEWRGKMMALVEGQQDALGRLHKALDRNVVAQEQVCRTLDKVGRRLEENGEVLREIHSQITMEDA